MSEIGENKIKRPQFIIFTDKDGTLNLEDKQLNHILNLITTMGGMVVPVTGRTVGDIEESMREQKIKVPEIIVGDNGANIYSTSNHAFLIKKLLNHEKVMNIVDEFLRNGGNLDYIRYTDGTNIFTAKQKEVKEYYRKSKTAKSYDDIYQAIQQADDITKVTLAGPKEQIEKTAEFVKKMDFWTDMDKTRFPKEEYQNYRLDIAQRNINKGEAVKLMVAQLKPRYGYLCVGNGYNDVSMFKAAMDDGMIAAIMNNSSPELREEMVEYSRSRKKGKVMVIPKDKDLANQYILKMAKMFQERIKAQETKRIQEGRRLPNVPRVEVKGIEGIEQRNISRGTGFQKRNRDR